MNTEIISNYKQYVKLNGENKIIEKNKILLEEKKNDPRSVKGSSDLSHPDVTHLEINIRQDIAFKERYGIQLRSTDICKAPFFRFDPVGPSHHNNNPSCPLGICKIDTPHFHYFDSDGYNNAYQVEEFKDTKKKERIISDINAGLALFCKEGNCTLSNGEIPEVSKKQKTLDLPKKDPLEGIIFK